MQEYIDFFMTHQMLSIAWVVIAGLVVYSFMQSKLAGVKTATTQEAITLINKRNAVVVDIRSSEDYKKGHIVNAKNITVSQINDAKFGGIEAHKELPVILVCDSGHRSSGAAAKLSKAGFTEVYSLVAGMDGWMTENFPTTKK